MQVPSGAWSLRRSVDLLLQYRMRGVKALCSGWTLVWAPVLLRVCGCYKISCFPPREFHCSCDVHQNMQLYTCFFGGFVEKQAVHFLRPAPVLGLHLRPHIQFRKYVTRDQTLCRVLLDHKKVAPPSGS
ncbi:hypothetical protein H920_05947 [Fukomys damarensis]|uniref:Uncharacterized protein n=1 Tax=Fukomys damarensis TaxID=885580 RepID=A0A091DKI2_FUKDA|nr:hypothetical protein H920_05947 [Fukomys damarensis]